MLRLSGLLRFARNDGTIVRRRHSRHCEERSDEAIQSFEVDFDFDFALTQ